MTRRSVPRGMTLLTSPRMDRTVRVNRCRRETFRASLIRRRVLTTHPLTQHLDRAILLRVFHIPATFPPAMTRPAFLHQLTTRPEITRLASPPPATSVQTMVPPVICLLIPVGTTPTPTATGRTADLRVGVKALQSTRQNLQPPLDTQLAYSPGHLRRQLEWLNGECVCLLHTQSIRNPH